MTLLVGDQMKLGIFLLFLLLASACVQKSEEKTSTAGSSTAPYVWSGNAFPQNLQISADFSNDEVSAITEMSTAWESAIQNKKDFFSIGARTPEISGSVGGLDQLYDGVLGVYKTSQWPSDVSASALAITQIFGRRHNIGSSSEFINIEHADILVNYDVHLFDTTDDGAGYDLRTVILHEMGHFLGLQHKSTTSSRSQSVMYPSIFSYETKRDPKQVDINDLASKYGISLGSGGAAAAAMASNEAAPQYVPQGAGEAIKILIELHADGKCVHKIDGVPVEHHHVDIK